MILDHFWIEIHAHVLKSLQSYDFFCNFAPKLTFFMKKSVFLIVFMAFFALTSMAEGLTYLSTDDFKKKVFFYDLTADQQPQWKYIGDKPCLIDFSTTWCGWCKKLHPILEQVAKEYEGKVYVYTLDAEKEPEVAALFGVRSYPTVIFCPMDGSPWIAQGYRELDYWKEAIRSYFGITIP